MGPCECEFWIRITPDTKQGFAKRVTYGLFTPSINFILLSLLSLPSSHTPPRNTPGVEQAGFLCKEGEPWGQCGASQASGWSVLMISISKCRSKQRLLIHMSWELVRIEHDRVRETDYFILLYNLSYKY